MDAKPKPLASDLTRLRGLSMALIRSHHEDHYAEAVQRLNAIKKDLSGLDFQSISPFTLNAWKREELMVANSALLHALYFGSLGGASSDISAAMAVALAANFGSVQRWKDEFAAMGRAQSGGSGWVLLTFSPLDGGLVNQCAADHSQALAGATPILALDMYEHAYRMDYGARAAAYVDAFMSNIHWEAVHGRYQRVVHHAAEALAAPAGDASASRLILDVRRAGVFEEAKELIAGAVWRDPARIGEWANKIPSDQKVTVYCVAGHEMSRGTALLLRSSGLDAQFLLGGIEAWKAEGGAMQPKRPTLASG